MKKINLKLQRKEFLSSRMSNTTSQFYFPLRYTSTMTHKWTTAWSNALLKRKQDTLHCAHSYLTIQSFAQACVCIYVCTCLSGSVSCSPFVWGLRRWSEELYGSKLDRLASLHKISTATSPKQGWRHGESDTSASQAWSKENQLIYQPRPVGRIENGQDPGAQSIKTAETA